jgi:cell division protein FtsB
MSLLYTSGARDASAPSRRVASRVGSCLAISLYAGFFLYCVLSLLFGPVGLLAYRRLEARKTAMDANLGELGTIRESLNAEIDSLKSDPDRAALEARSLGYLRKGETAVILGARSESVPTIHSGKVLPYAEPAALGDFELKEICLGAFLAMMALLLGPRKSRSARRRR